MIYVVLLQLRILPWKSKFEDVYKRKYDKFGFCIEYHKSGTPSTL